MCVVCVLCVCLFVCVCVVCVFVGMGVYACVCVLCVCLFVCVCVRVCALHTSATPDVPPFVLPLRASRHACVYMWG